MIWYHTLTFTVNGAETERKTTTLYHTLLVTQQININWFMVIKVNGFHCFSPDWHLHSSGTSLVTFNEKN